MADKGGKALSGAATGATAGAAFGPYGAVIGGVIGGVSGLLSGDDTTERATAGNRYGGDSQAAMASGQIGSAQTNLRALQDQPHRAAQQVGSDPILGQLYGSQGTLSRTVGEEQNLASRGYSLQPEDYEAYGQASGSIARMFGSQEKGLAQSLSARGLSSSGVAGQQFSGMYGNKQEQLGQLQTQIAQNRMKMNMDRLGQTRQFLSSMGAQSQNAIQNQYSRDSDSTMNNYNVNKNILDSIQNQDNVIHGQALAGTQPSDSKKSQGELTNAAKLIPSIMGSSSGGGSSSGTLS